MIEFLLDYYVWILVVLGIIIITIIGFLVDSKQKRKKKEVQGIASDEVKTVEPLPNINGQEVVPIVDAKTQAVSTNSDNLISTNNINESSTVVQPLRESNSNVNQNIALSEQKPHFEPREVSMSVQSQMSSINNENLTFPKPINPVSINQVNEPPVMSSQMPSSVYSNVQMAQPVQNLQQVPPVVTNGQMINNMQRVQQPAQTNLNNQQIVNPNVSAYNNMINNGQSNFYQNVPNQMPNYPAQQPTSPIYNTQNSQITAMPAQNSQFESTQTPAQPAVTTPNIGISFVTGESNNSNANDDTWKL